MKLTTMETERAIAAALRRAQYEGYLLSPRWAAKRRAKLIEANYTCAVCGYCGTKNPIDIPLDVHHKTYARLGDERLTDLEVLCRGCHERKHGARFMVADIAE